MEYYSCEEMLEAQAQVYHHLKGFHVPMSLKCAVQLGILDAIHAHGQPMTIPDLLSELTPTIPPSKSPFVYRLMRILTQMGYFKTTTLSCNDDNNHVHADPTTLAYSLTPLSSILLTNSPASLRLYLVSPVTEYLHEVARHLTPWFLSDQTGSVHDFEHGKSLWELSNGNPEFNSYFNEFMAGDTRMVVRALIEKRKEAFESLKTLVDVGGGNGAAATIIAAAFPGLKCTVYDLPHVVATVPDNSLLSTVGGNMFDYIPKADAIFLKMILHCCNDKECVQILNKCREAIPDKGGKVMIVDIVLANRKDSVVMETQLFWDMAMIMTTNGKEREEHEWKKLFMDAGFSGYKITPIGFRSLIEVFP